jgi:hypothetical protein
VSVSHDILGYAKSKTYVNCFDLSTIMANRFQDLLDLSKESCLGVSETDEQERLVRLTVMVDRHRQLDDSKVTRTLGHVLFAGGTFEVAIDGTQMRIVQTFFSRSKTRFILRFYDVRNMLQVTRFARSMEWH